MSEVAESLLEQVLALPPEDVAEITRRLHDAPGDDYDPLTDPEFRAELDRRIEAVGNGTAVLVDGDEVFAGARARFEERRSQP